MVRPTTELGFSGFGGHGYGGGDGGWLGMLLAISLLKGGWGHGGGASIEREIGMLNDNLNNRQLSTQIDMDTRFGTVNGRFNQIDGRVNHSETLGGINSLQREVGQLGFANAMASRDVKDAIAACCCETQKGLLENRFEMAKENWATNAHIGQVYSGLERRMDGIDHHIERKFDGLHARLTNDRMEDMRLVINNQQRQIDLAAFANVVNPCPRPAFVVQPPAPVNFPQGCGPCGPGWGWNGGGGF